MRLSKIKLSGFKSFVDPTTIRFPSNLMGIVGPNGCGKSNIIDAIRWVLGEGSAKTLRGDSMADVIFNGSGGRKPVGQASVELVFDNSDGTITGPYAGYAEVAIRRVVSRDGTSHYYLNNATCRRKDITHILLGTGLGSHGYSIIEQGMISRLVEAKPEELRAFLEEAAGISKYKERRRETEHRIRHTRENLERLSDLRQEVDKQLVHLQRQAKDATRYKELKTEQRKVGAELLALRLKSLRADVRSEESLLNEKQVALDAAIAEQRALESRIEKVRVSLGDSNDRFNEVQGAYYRVGAETARLEQSIQHRKELCLRQGEELHATDQQLNDINAHIESDRVEIEELERLLRELSPGLEDARASERASTTVLEEAERAMEQWRARLEEVARELAQTERSAHVEETRIEELIAQQARLERSTEKLALEQAELSTADLEQRLEAAVANDERLRAACENATRALDSVWQQIQQLREQDGKVAVHLDKLRSQLQNDRGRLTSLQALQEAALGKTAKRVGDWLEAQALHTKPRLAQDLRVDPGWERAVETVLGGYLEAVGVEDIGALSESLVGLTEGGLILIEEGVAASVRKTDRGEMLLDHVKGPATISHLMGRIRVAQDLATAVATRKGLAEGESVVTPDGFWLGRHWLRISRGDDPRVGVLTRAEEIKRLSAEAESGARRVAEVEKALADTRRRLEQLEETRVNAQREAGRRQQLQAEALTTLQTCKAELEQMRARTAALERDIAEIGTDRNALSSALQESRRRLEAATARRDELSGEHARLEASREERQHQVVEARLRAEQDRQRAQEMALQVESRRSSRQSASSALERVRAQREHLLRRRGELQAQIDTASAPLAEEEASLLAKLDERLTAERALAEARSALEAIDTELRQEEQRRNDKERVVSGARETVGAAKLAVREVQVRAETVAEQFVETGFELDAVLAALPEPATEAQWHETFERLERRIQRLGAINLAAIDEYRELSERKEYLDAQFKDLHEALETLENAIRKIDRETRARFRETFDNANQGLGKLFPRLFGGGHAYLELDSEDLLSAGVTVMARPPGKRISTIHLLSGGEKALTAVALVFSIFELNPAPFCLLDEVDAPLDDANVGRFSEIVREMSEQVQFVLITHNKTTMESMRQLTGVTMSEPGVSRLVAVDIEEAVKLAAM
jgi:chromosome segregation protein